MVIETLNKSSNFIYLHMNLVEINIKTTNIILNGGLSVELQFKLGLGVDDVLSQTEVWHLADTYQQNDVVLLQTKQCAISNAIVEPGCAEYGPRLGRLMIFIIPNDRALSEISLDECFSRHVMTDAHCEMCKNIFLRVARLLSCRAQVFLKRPSDAVHYGLGSILRGQLDCTGYMNKKDHISIKYIDLFYVVQLWVLMPDTKN